MNRAGAPRPEHRIWYAGRLLLHVLCCPGEIVTSGAFLTAQRERIEHSLRRCREVSKTNLRGRMFPNIAINLFLAIAAIPFIYYLLALYSSWNYFRQRTPSQTDPNFTPPISNLKPIRGLDPDAYENFASFCRQDYPDYEILFCVGDADDPVLPVIEKLIYDFPQCKIRVL